MTLIEYKVLPNNFLFNDIQIRANPKDAFFNAIKYGMKNPDNWIYMYSKNNRDYFKSCFSRKYISYPQFKSKNERSR